MTYDQFRDALSLVAKYGDEGAPNDLLPAGRWMDLRNSRVVVQRGAVWVITHQGWRVLEEPRRPSVRPANRPVQRKSPYAVRMAKRRARRSAANREHQQQQQQARSA